MGEKVYYEDGSYAGELIEGSDYGSYTPSNAIRHHKKKNIYTLILACGCIMLFLNLAPLLFVGGGEKLIYLYYTIPLFVIDIGAIFFSSFVLSTISKLLLQVEGGINPYVYEPEKYGEHKIDLGNFIELSVLKTIKWTDKTFENSSKNIIKAHDCKEKNETNTNDNTASSKASVHIDDIIDEYIRLKLSWINNVVCRLHLIIYPLIAVAMIMALAFPETIGFYVFFAQVNTYALVIGALSVRNNALRYKEKLFDKVAGRVTACYGIAFVLSFLIILVKSLSYGWLVYLVAIADLLMMLDRVFFKGVNASKTFVKRNVIVSVAISVVILFACFMAVLVLSLVIGPIRDAIVAYDAGQGDLNTVLTFWIASGIVSIGLSILGGVLGYRLMSKNK